MAGELKQAAMLFAHSHTHFCIKILLGWFDDELQPPLKCELCLLCFPAVSEYFTVLKQRKVPDDLTYQVGPEGCTA